MKKYTVSCMNKLCIYICKHFTLNFITDYELWDDKYKPKQVEVNTDNFLDHYEIMEELGSYVVILTGAWLIVALNYYFKFKITDFNTII